MELSGLLWTEFLFSANIYDIKGKIILSKRWHRTFLLAFRQLKTSDLVKVSDVLTVEVFLRSYSKFAVKCYWNSKIFQNVRDLAFLKKKIFFGKKLNFFLKSGKAPILF